MGIITISISVKFRKIFFRFLYWKVKAKVFLFLRDFDADSTFYSFSYTTIRMFIVVQWYTDFDVVRLIWFSFYLKVIKFSKETEIYLYLLTENLLLDIHKKSSIHWNSFEKCIKQTETTEFFIVLVNVIFYRRVCK